MVHRPFLFVTLDVLKLTIRHSSGLIQLWLFQFRS